MSVAPITAQTERTIVSFKPLIKDVYKRQLRAVALPLGCCPGELGISYQGLASRDKACAFLPNLCRREATDSLRYLRSDCPVDLKEGELEQFRQWRVTTVIDLRSAEEIARKPCAFAGREGFYYHSLPLAGGGLPDTEDDVAVFYFDMVEPGERMKQVMKTIAAAPGGPLPLHGGKGPHRRHRGSAPLLGGSGEGGYCGGLSGRCV